MEYLVQSVDYFRRLMERGGFLMWPIAVCSVLALAIILDRTVFFLCIRLHFRSFMAELVRLLSRRRFNGALDLARKRRNPSAILTVSYLENRDLDAVLRDDILGRVGSQELERVGARLKMLGSIAHVSPLLGLCGTVVGMINAFKSIEQEGQAHIVSLAGGIWQALLTTAAGLLVAIPALLAYHAFEAMVDRTSNRMAHTVSILNETLGLAPAPATAQPVVGTSGEASEVDENHAAL